MRGGAGEGDWGVGGDTLNWKVWRWNEDRRGKWAGREKVGVGLQNQLPSGAGSTQLRKRRLPESRQSRQLHHTCKQPPLDLAGLSSHRCSVPGLYDPLQPALAPGLKVTLMFISLRTLERECPALTSLGTWRDSMEVLTSPRSCSR